MIKINRNELKGIASIYVLANTPFSLIKELINSNVVEELKNQCGLQHLKDYYQMITSRAKRDEISIGLSYAVLIAFLTHKDNNFLNKDINIDVTRLKWGEVIEGHLKIKTTSESIIDIQSKNVSFNIQQV